MFTLIVRYLAKSVFFLVATIPLSAKIVVFWQNGFPTVDSEAVSHQALQSALQGEEQLYANSDALNLPTTLAGASLLVLPYGSAFPAERWQSIISFLRSGGNLLVIGGQPFRIPVYGVPGTNSYSRGRPQDAYSREIGILHTYQAPQTDGKTFVWKTGYSFLPSPELSASKFFVLEGRELDGLGYVENANGEKVAAPVVALSHTGPASGEMLGSRWIFLDFQPHPGYWDSANGISLIQSAATYARQGATSFWLEVPHSTLKKGETPQVIVHLRNTLKERKSLPQSGQVNLQLLSGSSILDGQQIDCSGSEVDVSVVFQRSLPPGFYRVRGTFQDDGKPREFYQNAFWVEDENLLRSGPVLGVNGDFLTRNGQPFFPFGTNYFTTEENGWDFSGPRNADVWERDFADMEKHAVSFVRTGVWMGQIKFLESDGGVSERFLRNVEAYLLCARQHNIIVNFTFFAFDPQTTLRQGDTPLTLLPGGNPYLDPVTIRAEQNYLRSVVTRFKDVPYLSWDLINEPSFSNPRRLWKGNTPNGDRAELQGWHTWLRKKYADIEKLSRAWSTTPDQLRDFEAVPLPGEEDLAMNVEHGDPRQVRAADYNLFAQEMFTQWAKTMVEAIRITGSKQLVDIGQDEGGVQNRVLNQFYGRAGVSFTTNHTYRQNDALLWDSLAAKVPGVPNIVGETGYQPVILPNGEWRYDELTGFSLIERKWAYGFAGGSSGSLSWDWAREIYFGIERSDGSAKIWEGLMRDMGEFAKTAQVYATSLMQPDIAIVLPQSLQLTQLSQLALEAQQNCVRALYGLMRSEAYVVGEYQIELLGHPKLIIVPSPWMFSDEAWHDILKAVNEGATLLVSGRFDRDPHFNSTDRAKEMGIAYEPQPLKTRYNEIEWRRRKGPAGLYRPENRSSGECVFTGRQNVRREVIRQRKDLVRISAAGGEWKPGGSW